MVDLKLNQSLTALNLITSNFLAFWLRSSGGSDGKRLSTMWETPGFDPWVGKFPGEGNGNPLQYSCLENPLDGGAWCPWGRKELDTTE